MCLNDFTKQVNVIKYVIKWNCFILIICLIYLIHNSSGCLVFFCYRFISSLVFSACIIRAMHSIIRKLIFSVFESVAEKKGYAAFLLTETKVMVFFQFECYCFLLYFWMFSQKYLLLGSRCSFLSMKISYICHI